MPETIERRCVVTREVTPREGLVRLVRAPDGQVFVDYRARLPGRGAWVTPSRPCVEILMKKPGLLSRHLRGEVKVEGLLDALRQANQRAVEDLLSLAARSGVLVGGKDGLRAILASRGAAALLLAADLSPRRVEELSGRAGDLPVFTLHLDADALGQRIGKGPRAALALRPSRVSRSLMDELRRSVSLR